MYKRYYTIDADTEPLKTESVRNALGDIIGFKTYRDAYIEMVNIVSGQIGDGEEPELYTIRRHDISEYNGSVNTMVQPVWS